MGSGLSSALTEYVYEAMAAVRRGVDYVVQVAQDAVSVGQQWLSDLGGAWTQVWDERGPAEALRKEEEERAVLDEELERSKAREEALLGQVSRLNEEIHAVRARLEGRDDDADEIRELEAELAEVEAENAGLARDVAEADADADRFTREADEAEAAAQGFKAEIAKLKRATKGLDNKISRVYESLPVGFNASNDASSVAKTYGSGVGMLTVLSGPAPCTGWGSKVARAGSSEGDEAAAF